MSRLLYEGVMLSPLEKDDLPMVYDLNMTYGICSGAGFWRDMPTYEAFEGWMSEYLKRIDKTKCHLVVSEYDEICGTRKGVGVVSAFNMSDVHRTAEVSIRILEEFQGKGIAKKALRLVLEYLFKIRGYRKVYAQVYTNNVVSTNLFISAGFKREATLLEHEMHMGKYMDVAVYSIWSKDFADLEGLK